MMRLEDFHMMVERSLSLPALRGRASRLFTRSPYPAVMPKRYAIPSDKSTK